jgi:hypothetical protein
LDILEINLYGFEKTYPDLPFFDILQINLSGFEKNLSGFEKNLSRFEMVLRRARLSSTFYQSKTILKHLSLSELFTNTITRHKRYDHGDPPTDHATIHISPHTGRSTSNLFYSLHNVPTHHPMRRQLQCHSHLHVRHQRPSRTHEFTILTSRDLVQFAVIIDQCENHTKVIIVGRL